MSASKFKLLAIVEGPGDEDAVPFLLRTWFFEHDLLAEFETSDLAISANGCGRLTAEYNAAKHLGIEHYVSRALLDDPDAILVLLDADKECIKRENEGLPKYGPTMLARAKTAAIGTPVSVVIADPELEMWFLAAQKRLTKCGMFHEGELLSDEFFSQPKSGCKGKVEELIGRKYVETADQAKFASQVSFKDAEMSDCRSFKKLAKELNSLVEQILDS